MKHLNINKKNESNVDEFIIKIKPAFFILVLLLFILPNFVFADVVGPDVFVSIHVLYNGNEISNQNFTAVMLGCFKEDKNYYSGENLIPQLNIKEYDPLNNCYWKPKELDYCYDSRCKFYAFSFFENLPSKFKLAVYIPSLDKVFISNAISRTRKNSSYEVNLNPDNSAKIHEVIPSLWETIVNINPIVKAILITLIIELSVAIIYISKNKLPKKILISVFIGNLITLLLILFILSLTMALINIISLAILLSEIFAVVFEAYFIYYLNKRVITFKKSFILSIIMNLVSFVIGVYLLYQRVVEL